MTVAGMQNKKANHSPLMQALSKASLGESPNFCPFGCQSEQLDENGYCRHLVGFTVPGEPHHFEPLAPPDAAGYRTVRGARREPVRKGDRLVQITVSSRVYRDVDAKG